VALPEDTLTDVPTGVPPEVQVVGAEDCGPKTVNEMVPVGLDPEASIAEIKLVAIAVPRVSVPGPEAVRVGVTIATTVSDIPEPQVEVAGLLLPSPLYNAYHQ
jgi:hypothetical protein